MTLQLFNHYELSINNFNQGKGYSKPTQGYHKNQTEIIENIQKNLQDWLIKLPPQAKGKLFVALKFEKKSCCKQDRCSFLLLEQIWKEQKVDVDLLACMQKIDPLSLDLFTSLTVQVQLYQPESYSLEPCPLETYTLTQQFRFNPLEHIFKLTGKLTSHDCQISDWDDLQASLEDFKKRFKSKTFPTELVVLDQEGQFV